MTTSLSTTIGDLLSMRLYSIGGHCLSTGWKWGGNYLVYNEQLMTPRSIGKFDNDSPIDEVSMILIPWLKR